MTFRSSLLWGCAASLLIPIAGIAQATAQAASFCPSCVACAGADAPARTVHVKIYNGARVRQPEIDALVEVANTIWQPYAVSLEPAAPAAAVAVVIDPRGDASSGRVVLGDTLFDAGHATPYIRLWRGAAEAIAEATPIRGIPFTLLPFEQRDRIMGRMLGVALAHEIGHYLLDSRQHSERGLLQANISLRDTDEANLPNLGLTGGQQLEICAARRK